MPIEAARLTVVVDAATDAAERGLESIGHKVNGAGGMIRDVASTAGGFLVGQIVTAAGAAGASMVRLGIDTQTALNVFQGVTGASGDTMARVSGLARDLGNDLSLPATSAKDATLAMVELAKAGLSVDNTMAAAKGTLQLAAAANTDAATAAQITANALNAFGLSGDKAGKVADLLAGAANSSSGEITDMANALQMSSAVYANAGMSIESLTTSIGLMANKGIIGSDAGTSLKQMLLSLQAPTDKAVDVLKKMGISLHDSAGHMRPMRDLIAQFTEKTKGMTDAQRDAALKTIFGTDAIRAATIVMTGGTQAYDQMFSSVTKAGSAQEVAAARMKGLGGAVEGLKSQVETLLIDGFNRIAPAAETGVRFLSEHMPQAIDAVSQAFRRVAEVAGPIIQQVSAWVVEHWPQIQATAEQVFNRVREIIASVVEWIQANWPRISETISQVLETVRTIVETILEGIEAFWRTWGGTISTFVQGLFEGISQIIDGLMKVIRGVIDVVMGLIRGDWERVWNGLRDFVKGIWDIINGLVDAAIAALRLVIEAGMKIIAGVFDNIWDGIKSAASAAWDGIKHLVSEGADAIWSAISELPGKIAGLGLAFIAAGVGVGKALINGLAGGLRDLVSSAAGIAGDLAGAVRDALANVWNEVAGFIESAMQKGVDALDVALGPAINFSNTLTSGIIPRFHTGGIVPGAGEVLAVLRGGEGVFTPDQMRVLGQWGARGGVPSSSSYAPSITINVGSVRNDRDINRIRDAVAVAQARASMGRSLAADARGFAR